MITPLPKRAYLVKVTSLMSTFNEAKPSGATGLQYVIVSSSSSEFVAFSESAAITKLCVAFAVVYAFEDDS